jgi:hypothetical protein
MAKEGYVQYNLKLRESQMGKAKKEAEKRDIPLSQLIRDALNKELKRK